MEQINLEQEIRTIVEKWYEDYEIITLTPDFIELKFYAIVICISYVNENKEYWCSCYFGDSDRPVKLGAASLFVMFSALNELNELRKRYYESNTNEH